MIDKNRNINVPLLRKTMEHIESRPWEWNQASWVEPAEDRRWFLRSVMKNGVRHWKEYKQSALNGMTKKKTAEILQTDAFTCDAAFCFAGWAAYFDGAEPANGDKFSSSTSVINPRTGKRVTIRDYAQEALGLNPFEANSLFDGTNTLQKLRSKVDSLIRRAS